MVFRITHIHVKSADPRATAEWYVEAFRFRILSDTVRPRFGDRFIRCETEDGGAIVNFSGAQEGERLPPGRRAFISGWSISASSPTISRRTSSG